MDELLSLIDDFKMKLTDNEYKAVVDKIADLQKKQKKNLQYYFDVIFPLALQNEDDYSRSYKMRVRVKEDVWNRYGTWDEIEISNVDPSTNDVMNIKNLGSYGLESHYKIIITGKHTSEDIGDHFY